MSNRPLSRPFLKQAAAALDRRLMDLARLRSILTGKHNIGRRVRRKVEHGEDVRAECMKLKASDKEAAGKCARVLSLLFGLSSAATWEHKRQAAALKALGKAGRVVTLPSIDEDQKYVAKLLEALDSLVPQLRKARADCRRLLSAAETAAK